MDHLILPRHPILPPTRVPLVCKPYDNGDFLTYPERAGEAWKHAIPGDIKLGFSHHEIEHPSNVRDLEQFLQRWLFFGLLHELGAIQHDFVEDGYVHTRGIDAVLKAYTPSKRTVNILEIAENVLCCLSIDPLTLTSRIPDFNPAIRTSIVSLYDLLAAFLQVRFDPDIMSRSGAYDLIRPGMCPATEAREMRFGASNAYLWYIKHIGEDARDHSTCTDVCRYAVVDADYRPRHVCDQGCDMVGPEPERVKEILRSGSIPVLGESMHLYSSDRPYVAVSHVWAEGLGNPGMLELPECSLNRIWTYVRALNGRTFGFKNGEIKHDHLFLWIDTLLVPQNDPFYATAMARLADVYKSAAYVLILDRSLQQLKYADMDECEALARIHLSQWSGRLWTLQEATLGPKLLFQFADQAVDLRDLKIAVKEAYQTDFMRRPLATALLSKCIEMDSLGANLLEHGEVSYVFRAVTTRKAQRQDNQAECAATLLGFPNDTIVAAETSADKLTAFWRLVAEAGLRIPHTILFNDLPELAVPGLRWAPAAVPNDFVTMLSGSQNSAQLTPDGLQVKLPCWRISVESRGSSTTSNRYCSAMPFLPVLHGEQWYLCEDRDAWERICSGNDHILHSTADNRNCLLGSMSNVFRGSRLTLNKAKPEFNKLYELGRVHAELLLKSPAYAWPGDEWPDDHGNKLTNIMRETEKVYRSAQLFSEDSNSSSISVILNHTLNVYMGRFAVVEETWEDRVVCVD